MPTGIIVLASMVAAVSLAGTVYAAINCKKKSERQGAIITILVVPVVVMVFFCSLIAVSNDPNVTKPVGEAADWRHYVDTVKAAKDDNTIVTQGNQFVGIPANQPYPSGTVVHFSCPPDRLIYGNSQYRCQLNDMEATYSIPGPPVKEWFLATVVSSVIWSLVLFGLFLAIQWRRGRFDVNNSKLNDVLPVDN